MTALFSLLEQAAGPLDLTSGDVEADVARGIRALRRRRTGAAGGFLAVGVAAAAVPALAGGAVGDRPASAPAGGSTAPTAATSTTGMSTLPDIETCTARPDPVSVTVTRGAEILKFVCGGATARVGATAPTITMSAGPTMSVATGPSTELRVPLQAYGGPPAGSYRVTLIPKGWIVQGGNPTVITIGRPGDPDTNPIDFQGKVVAMLSTPDQVPGHAHASAGTAFVRNVGDTASLYLKLSQTTHGGSWLTVQYPISLGWTEAVAEKFARGVVVLPSATPGLG